MAFADVVIARLEELGLNVNQAETRANLPTGFIRSVVRDDSKRAIPSIEKAEKIAEALGMEIRIGPRVPPSGPDTLPNANDEEYAQLPLYEAILAAGSGAENGTDEIIESLAFRRDWLRKIGVSPSNAVLARVSGDSMHPTISHGDMVLIDRAEAEVKARGAVHTQPHIYAFLEGGEARVKRIDRVGEGVFAVISDSRPLAIEVKTEIDLIQMSIIGRVRWWGHTEKG
ncbi:MAG: helix-turn-helix transcriptional regulator [Rhodobacteraceae bacterium]|nr:MAG: helix-turn-helix transcriptional regulator [Paracoccaceae bacterium]